MPDTTTTIPQLNLLNLPQLQAIQKQIETLIKQGGAAPLTLPTNVNLAQLANINKQLASQHPASQEPDDELTQSTLWLQGSLNKLGANPPLAEDGKNGPKTMAAVSQFQRENGLSETGLADAATIAAIGQRLGSPPVSGQAPGDPLVAIKQLLGQLQKSGGIQVPTSANDLTTTLQQVADIVQKINIVPNLTPSASIQAQDQAAQLQKILDFVGGLINPTDKSRPLGQVNGALGKTIGNLLNGNKTAIGLIGSLLTEWLSNVPALPPGASASGLMGLLQQLAGSVPGLSGFTMPLFLAISAWGLLGKLEKWAQGTAPPPKMTK